MSESTGTKVFILGAGCSADCGYPLGKGLASQLEDFQTEISGRFPVIEPCVRNTINLAKEHSEFDTLDQLAKHLEDDFDAWRRRERSGFWDQVDEQTERLVTKQIIDAKIAIATLFLAREEKATQTGLANYRSFITQILGGPPWMEAAKEADCHVLTFNYDRLFEIAFLNSFTDFKAERDFVYGENALNSSFSPHGDCTGPKPGQFSFLKLHGSVGWWVTPKRGGGSTYGAMNPNKPMSLEQIEQSIPKQYGRPFGGEPLLAFPHERQKTREYFNHRGESSGHAWAPYTDAVWQHAASVVAAAAEIRVIGYSFNAIDSRYMVNELLSKAKCDRIVIQNKIDIRNNLESYKQLRGRLDFDPTPFGTNSGAS